MQGTHDIGYELSTYLAFLLVQVECNSKLDPTKTTLLKVMSRSWPAAVMVSRPHMFWELSYAY